eukprot:6717495-Karenia_brevis.AAC.1
MVHEFAEAMAEHGLGLKASKSFWMHNRYGEAPKSGHPGLSVVIRLHEHMDPDGAGHEIIFKKCPYLVVLGVALSPNSDAQ